MTDGQGENCNNCEQQCIAPAPQLEMPMIESAAGSKVISSDGKEFVDFDCRGGAVLLGHANEQIVTAVTKAARRGLTTLGCGKASEKLATQILGCFDNFSAAVFFESSLAAMLASVRTVRSLTKRSEIVSCGCGPVEAANQGHYNNIDSVKRAVDEAATPPAAIYVPPVRTCCGVTRPDDGFLAALRKLCDDTEAMLVFDERSTAFRLAFGGAQNIYDVKPDLSILGGVIGGGLPLGCVLCDKQHQDMVTTRMQSANQLAIACGLATLEPLRDGAIYGRLEALGASLCQGLTKAIAETQLSASVRRSGSMLTLRLDTDDKINAKLYRSYRGAMLEKSILLPADATQPWFLTAAHDEKDISAAAAATADILGAL